MSYKIRIKTLDGDKLTFKGVSKYETKDGFLTFKDQRTKKTKIFAVSNSEIEIEGEFI